MTFFLKYFNDSETQTPSNHAGFFVCEDCISYFGEPVHKTLIKAWSKNEKMKMFWFYLIFS